MRDINCDAFIQQGTTHNTCQDYACAGETDDYPYVVVCDGCSGSPDTDIGARILARCAASLIPILNTDSTKNLYANFGRTLIRQARNFLLPGLMPSALDATVLAAVALEDRFRVVVYGDGIVCSDNKELSQDIEFTMSAPLYLNYTDDNERLDAYRVAGPKLILNEDIPVDPEATELLFDLPYSTTSCIGIGSDGWKTFTNTLGETVPLHDFRDEMTAFKNSEGVFVQRRLHNNLVRKLSKRGFKPADDISYAALLRSQP